ncbi:50S ribosomal L7/L12 [Gossypium australe]|uniref:50S ribosomal L7/L12 n=1 Tax=Gossypium australe TaxID=47621 RepID=A0A5B6ULF9_9ROSI|nr:50S ribosomal L7/L12 [Gossypium australe]
MASTISKIPTHSLFKLLVSSTPKPPASCFISTSTAENRTQKLERIADELLDLTKLERYDYSILFRLKLGLNRYGPAVSGVSSAAASAPGTGSSAAETKTVEKTAFDIKLEKFDAAAKIKIIKEVRTFTELGLKEAKDMVEKVPVVVKKGVTKEEAEAIIKKLQELGATVKEAIVDQMQQLIKEEKLTNPLSIQGDLVQKEDEQLVLYFPLPPDTGKGAEIHNHPEIANVGDRSRGTSKGGKFNLGICGRDTSETNIETATNKTRDGFSVSAGLSRAKLYKSL